MQMTSTFRLAASAALLLALVGCASQNHRAPVEDRTRSGASGSSASSSPARVLPGAENAGKAGYYTVKPGDTLIRISLESGQNWRDLAAWNNLDNPNLIEVGQVLRVVAPVADAASGSSAVVSAKPVTSPKIEARPLDSKASSPAKAAAASGAVGASGAASASSGAASAASSAASSSDAKDTKDSKDAKDADEPNWVWPANGPLIGGFEEGKRKGLAIGGKAGDPVVAAADGRVVYAGSGLRGYGNLVIIKHNGDYLTAYAHNQTLLVKEDQAVRKGQKIAEMGATDADRVQLHFEIRKQGKPIDPAKQLPAR
jgi:lipoprotein NlpD